MPRRFEPGHLDRRVLALPLLEAIEAKGELSDNPAPEAPEEALYDVIIDVNLDYHGGRDAARRRVLEMVGKLLGPAPAAPAPPVAGARPSSREGVHLTKSAFSRQYLFGAFRARTLFALIQEDGSAAAVPAVQPTPAGPGADDGPGPAPTPSDLTRRPKRAIHLIWLDSTVRARLTKTLSTVKADAAHHSFSAMGEDIVWAVLDSGVQEKHPHFELHQNLKLTPPLEHRDFVALNLSANPPAGAEAGADPLAVPALDVQEPGEAPLADPYGHGTHVAGIIAGEKLDPDGDTPILAVVREEEEDRDPVLRRVEGIKAIAGMAPRCKLLSLRVLNEAGEGKASDLIAALGLIQELNGYGRRLVVHGVNISAGYPFYPEWFACGQSPVCVEVNRLVKSGVVVVVAAGNTGYSFESAYVRRTGGATPAVPAGQALSINDPGNAEGAITVGSTHREMPNLYGVSYFSSKGPTGDGRLKPDLVAPGEKVISCAAGNTRTERVNGLLAADPLDNRGCDYAEDSGTSMATLHVSGAIAAFLSIRREYIGRAEEVKNIFLSTATDLGRDRYFQGRGMVDLMRAIQSV